MSDDAGSDEARDYVSGIGDPRIHYRRNATRLGAALNHYAGFQAARGEYIACLNDDDTWEPSFLAEMLGHLEQHPEVVVAFCDHWIMDEEGKVLEKVTEEDSRKFGRVGLRAGLHRPFYHLVMGHCIPMVMAAVFRRSILDGAPYPRRLGGVYDLWLSHLAVRTGGGAYYDPRRLTNYRIHSTRYTERGGSELFRASIYVNRCFLKMPEYAAYHSHVANDLGMVYGQFALHLARNRKWRRAWILERTAFRLMNRWKNRLGLVKKTAATFWKMALPAAPSR